MGSLGFISVRRERDCGSREHDIADARSVTGLYRAVVFHGRYVALACTCGRNESTALSSAKPCAVGRSSIASNQ